MNLSAAVIVATAVMVHLVAPQAEAEADSAVDPVDLVAPVERAVVPAVDPVPRKAHKVRAADRNAGTVLPDPAAMVALAFALRVSARPRPHPRRCLRSTSRSRPKI